MSSSSHRQIIKSSAIVGGASVISVLIGVANLKILAVLLGPPGVALMGIYQNIMNIAATLSGCGLGSSGVRQIAASAQNTATLTVVRRSLWFGSIGLGLFGLLALWFLSKPVSITVFGNVQHSHEIGWLGVGVFFSLLSGSQTALLKGLRRIGDLARITILSSLVGALVGASFVLTLGTTGVVFYALASPFASYLVARRFVSNLDMQSMNSDWRAISRQLKDMLKLGVPMMAATLLTLLAQLTARALILKELGVDAVGNFQAAWVVSMTCIGFVLGAMGTDYYPRMTACIHDHAATRKLIDNQMETALLLAGPVLLTITILSPVVIGLLYTSIFSPAAEVLRWQMLGDILKTASWPMGFVLMSQSRGGILIATEMTWNAVYLGVTWFALDIAGLVASGIGYFSAYVLYCILLTVLVYRLIGFRLSIRCVLAAAYLLLASITTMLLSFVSDYASYVVGVPLMLVATGYSAYRLNSLLNLRAWLLSRTRK